MEEAFSLVSVMVNYRDDDSFVKVNVFALAQNLTWDGRSGNPHDIRDLVENPDDSADVFSKYESLFDHTFRFKTLGRGRLRPVLAISTLYCQRDNELEQDAAECARLLGLSVRVSDEADRVFVAESSLDLSGDLTPILFWRSNLHQLR